MSSLTTTRPPRSLIKVAWIKTQRQGSHLEGRVEETRSQRRKLSGPRKREITATVHSTFSPLGGTPLRDTMTLLFLLISCLLMSHKLWLKKRKRENKGSTLTHAAHQQSSPAVHCDQMIHTEAAQCSKSGNDHFLLKLRQPPHSLSPLSPPCTVNARVQL